MKLKVQHPGSGPKSELCLLTVVEYIHLSSDGVGLDYRQ